MVSLHSAEQFVFGSWANKPVQIEQVEDNLSSDVGLLAFYQLDQKLGWTESLTGLISDPRTDPTHSALSIVRQRIFGIIAGYEDQNDHEGRTARNRRFRRTRSVSSRPVAMRKRACCDDNGASANRVSSVQANRWDLATKAQDSRRLAVDSRGLARTQARAALETGPL